MAKPKRMLYKLLPEWTIRQNSNSLIISGGADARFEIELEGDETSFFSSPRNTTPFNPQNLSEVDQRVLEELVAAEIVVPVLQKHKVIRVTTLGDKTNLMPSSSDNVAVVKSSQDYDLALIIRSNSTYADLLKEINYQSIVKPHLFVDAAFHHTFSIGPLVFPGETACIACLQGRVSTRWGDDTPPTSPKTILNQGNLIRELISAEVARIAQEDTSLTNKTISWNFQDRVIRKDQLLKVPLCPICTQNKIDRKGSIALPWKKDESAKNTV